MSDLAVFFIIIGLVWSIHMIIKSLTKVISFFMNLYYLTQIEQHKKQIRDFMLKGRQK